MKSLCILFKIKRLQQISRSYLWLVIGQDPGEHWILHKVIVCPSSNGVQMHQVFKVTYFPFLQDNNMKRNNNYCSYVIHLREWYRTNNQTLTQKHRNQTKSGIHSITCHLTRCVFSITDVFLKHNKNKYFQHASQADHWTVSACFLCCLATHLEM